MLTPLQEGDAVSAVAPCGPVGLDRLKDGLAMLQSWGLRIKTHGDVTARDRYLAGTDSARAIALNDAIQDPATKAIFCLRGGYGAARIVDRIDWDTLVETGKIFVGFSDVTTFHIAIAERGGTSLHAPNLTSYDLQHDDLPALRGALFGNREESVYLADSVRPGKAEGVLWGGNLTVIVHALAAGFKIPENAIVFVEDINEADYRLDRALTALAAHKKRIRGLICGEFIGCEGDYISNAEFKDFLDLLAFEFGERVDCPVITGFPVGHGERNVALAINRSAKLDGGAGRLELVEDLCR